MIKKIFIFIVFISNLFSNENSLSARGVVESNDKTILSSELGGVINSIPKSNGDYFKKGDILIKIDCDIYKAEMEKIAVKRDLAKVKLNKNIQLLKYNSVGQFDIDTSKLELQENEVAYKIAAINVERCEIKAPFTGRVVQKMVNKYQTVKPQEQLIEIISSESLEIKSVVPANWLSWLKIGQDITFKVDEIDKEIKTKILQIDSMVDSKSQTINIRARIENPDNIIAGMSGTVSFVSTTSK